MTQMTFGISVQVPNGPQMALTGTQAAEAYDKIELTVDPGGGAAPEVNIQIQPAAAVAVTLVLVKSSVYGADITYKLSDGATDTRGCARRATALVRQRHRTVRRRPEGAQDQERLHGGRCDEEGRHRNSHRPRRDAVTALLCPIVPSACHKETVPCQPH
ncbi:MAG: hypothetical protein ABWY12_11685 [Burkholderiales bacterium]